MITVQNSSEYADLEGAVEEDIRKFEEWFRSLGNDPLVRPEIAILKTYLFFKIRAQSENPAPKEGQNDGA